MKIAVTARMLGGRLEGVGHYTRELLSRLVSAYPNDEWHIIYDTKDDRYLLKGDNVINHFIGPRTRHPWLITFWLEYQLPVLLKKIGPDLVWYPDGLISLKSSVPTLQTIHDLAYISYPEGNRKRDLNYYKKNMPKYIKRADHIITISNYTKQIVENNFAGVKNKITVVYNGYAVNYKPINIEDRQVFRNKITAGCPYFLHLGAIHPRKNVERLIAAFEIFKKQERNCKLILAGRMAWKSEDVRSLMADSPARKDIIHLDDIDDIIFELVGSASALCSLSLVEGFGLPVLEAMASGVPVIVSANSAMLEVAGAAALSCVPTDIEAIAALMNQVTTNVQLVEEKIGRGLSRAQVFNWDKASTQVYKAMTKIVQ